jgi:transposase
MTETTKFKWIMYYEIHKQHNDGKKPSQIASCLQVDTRTVKKYIAMTVPEYEQFLERNSTRSKKLLDYEDFVRQRIENCLEASSAQVHDWLKEAHPDFINVSERTVYNFVMQVRNKYALAKVFSSRQFTMVEELPYGQQAQVDFGEYNMTDTDKNRKKVYFFTMVLSRSRYKFVYFSHEPFTTQTTIQAFEQAFVYIDGYPSELVMDQDKLLLYKENKGDLILTEKFRSYCMGQPFRLHFCRKNDPQSKGKIENVVKYVKYNFLRGRTFYDVQTLNVQAMEWLNRTANIKVHATTRKIPAQEWIIEKNSLFKHNIMNLMPENKASYSVRIDNAISYKGSLYSLPEGTYQGPSTQIYTQEEDGDLIICDKNSTEIARHRISLVKGSQIRNNNHFRNTDTKISALIRQVSEMFSSTEKATAFLEEIRKQKPRYIRDQIKIIAKVFERYDKATLDQALDYCIENKIYNATDFEPVALTLGQEIETTTNPPSPKSAISKYIIIPEKSSISDYKQILH